MSNVYEVQQQYLESRARFIETELDLGITFCGIARTTKNPDTRRRNISNAEKASETAAATLRNLSFDSEVVVCLRRKLSELASLIEDCKRLV